MTDTELRRLIAEQTARRDRMHRINQAWRKSRGRPGWDAGLDLTAEERQRTEGLGRGDLPYRPSLILELTASIRQMEASLHERH